MTSCSPLSLGASLDPDYVLTNVMIYWLTNTAASAARFYYEDAATAPVQHFAAHDAPDLLVDDIRQFFGKVR